MDEKKIIIRIEDSWSTNRAIGLRGFVLTKDFKPKEVTIKVDNTIVPITSWQPRPDIVAAYPGYIENNNCGFVVVVPRLEQYEFDFCIKVNGDSINKTLQYQSNELPLPKDYHDSSNLFNEFIQLVNHKHLSVLEIGSRIVSPGSKSKRDLFKGAKEYIGFDYYQDDNTDVVGDAHTLSDYFKHQTFDAVFSISVFEHLAMPWKVALEISKVLKVGGYSFQATHFAWPLHEKPWDFYRFSDQGLRSIFSRGLGFQTIDAGLYSPLRMYMDQPSYGQEMMPKFLGYGGCSILSKKVDDIDDMKFKWDASINETFGKESHYPKKNEQ